ncbi:MAG TPA: LuxR C-terminal-related transcriptional regulator [Actinomycetota bacterium]|nr:LuxR C-terminal-related transcriptional regulator [Actinomycetota bacterium]
MDIAGRSQVPGYDVGALMVLSTVLRYEGHTAQAVERAEEAVRRTGEAMFPPPGPWAVLVVAYMEADRLRDAERILREDLRRAEEVGMASLLVSHHRGLGDMKFAAGEWDEAVAAFETADVLAQEIGQGRRSRPGLALVAVHRHRLDEAADHLDVAAGAVGSLDRSWVRSLWHEAGGDPRAAYGVLRDAVEDPAVAPPMLMPTLALVDLVRLAIRTGDRPAAERVTRRVAEDAERRDTPTARGNALRCKGLLEDDAATLLAAVAEYRSGPRPLELALGCEDAAAALARSGRTNEARVAFREALETFERLGAAWDVSRCQAVARECGIKLRVRRPRATARTGWDSLSPTERTVAGLAASGLSNPEIGRRLFISRRTVETHLSHVFQKLGLASRIELAGVVARLGHESLQGGQQP